MRCHPPKLAVVLLCIAAAVSGCAPQQPLYFRSSSDLSHYVGLSATIDAPDLPEPRFSELEGTIKPFLLSGQAPKDLWNLSLEDTIRFALQNAKVMRQIGGQVQGPASFLTSNPGGAPTIYDPAITDTDARFGLGAGLSLFDPQLTTDLSWQRNHEPRNVNQNDSATLPTELNQDAAQLNMGLSKTTADGSTLSVSMSTAYDLERNNPTIQFLHDYQTAWQVEMRRPLWQGYGVEYNRIAGPGAIPGFNQGVLIARVNSDIALATFEVGVRNMVSDVEIAYWELYYAYRNLDTAVQGRDSSLKMWQKVASLYTNGLPGGDASSEAQAREQYFLFRSTAEQAQSQLYQIESKLRYMMGIAATDGRLIRPIDEPTTAKITFDWSQVATEAMARSPEIREARFRVKQRELELIAAKNYLLPRLDLVGTYRWLGMGNSLIDRGNSNISGGALDNLGSGEFQDWNIEIQGSIPIGFRKQKDGVLNAELALERERAKLRETELEVSSQLQYALRDMDTNLVVSETNFNRRLASQKVVEADLASYDTGQNGPEFLNNLLNAQRSLAQAESDYYRSVTNYAKSISQVHYRKGSLLEYNGVYLTEGPWPAKAYFDARRRARARSAALYLDYGFTYPKVVSQGPIPQVSGKVLGAEEMPAKAADSAPGTPSKQTPGNGPEVLPTPPARPAAPSEPARPGSTAVEVLPIPPAPGTHDLGFLNWGPLAPSAGAAAATSSRDPAVQKAAYIDIYDLGKGLPAAERP